MNCLEGDDEVGCAQHECPSARPHRCPGSFACVNAVVCNGVSDCPDGSDEHNCPPDSEETVTSLPGAAPTPKVSSKSVGTHKKKSEHDIKYEDNDEDLTIDEYSYPYEYDPIDGKMDPEENEPEPEPVPEIEPEVDLVHPDPGNDNQNGHRHGYDWNPDGDDDTMTMLEDDSRPAASSDRAKMSGGAQVQFTHCLLALTLATCIALNRFCH